MAQVAEPLRPELRREILARLVAAGVADPPAWASHVLRHGPDDIEACLGMVEALKRRFRSGADLGAKVTRKQPGHYVVETATGRAYAVAVYGRAPGEASCECADFLRSALGVCKHVTFVAAQQASARGAEAAPAPVLDWNPIRPWTGPDQAWWRLFLTDAVAGTELHWNKVHDALLRPVTDVVSPAPFAAHAEKLVARLGERASPAAQAVVRDLVAEAERRRTFATNASAAGGFVKRSKRALFEYQSEGVQRLLYDGRLLLGDDMGLGKTTQVIAAASALFSAKRIRRALVVVPAPIKSQWAREWSVVSSVPVTLVDGPPEERAAAYAATGTGILLMNYEQVVRDADAVRALEPDLIVLDEAQRIKNWAAKTSIVMKSLTPRYRWVVTGTPFENRLDELASLVEWLDDHAMEPKWRLDCFHAERADGSTTVVGAKHLATIRQRIEHCVLRRTRDEVLSQLPDRTDVHRVLPMTDAQRIEHDVYNRDIASLVMLRQKRPLRPSEFLQLMKLLNLQRMYCNAAILPSDGAAWAAFREAAPAEALPALGSPKLEELRQIVREVVVAQGRKVVVFSQWRRMLKWANWAVRDLLEDARVTAAFFTGAEPEKRRRENVIRFHDDPTCRVLFLTDAGGVGLNLQRAASALINLEFPWNPAVLEQRVGRVHRLGQRKPVTVFLLSSGEGIEARVRTLIGDKRALFRGLFESTEDTITFERAGEFLSSLAKVLPEARDVAPRAAEAIVEADAEIVERALEPLDDPEAALEDIAAAAPPKVEPAPLLALGFASPDAVRTLFERVKVERLEGGGVRVEAPAESADVLEALLRGVADLFGRRPS